LRQHQENPVDWYPWGDEAFDKARKDDKPIFLSVGYSSCHWCHVMAHESFEDQHVAHALNRYFVNVKVDREERPDVDEQYMTAVQLATGRGGWPMSVFLRPDGAPFHAGTYFPKEARGEFPGFAAIVTALGRAYQDQREQINEAAEQFSGALKKALLRLPPPPPNTPVVSVLDRSLQVSHQAYDDEHGGFGNAPKFPPHATLSFLAEYSQGRNEVQSEAENPEAYRAEAREICLGILEAMALGGIHDHVGGGFHRYSTDERWLLPHFEKMLYDNAQLLVAYAKGLRLDPNDEQRQLFEQTIKGIVGWLEREMTSQEGLFYSALDADSEGEEGKFYVWSASEIKHALGANALDFMAEFNVSTEGNYHDEATREKTGFNVLHRSSIGEPFTNELNILLRERNKRVKPGLDYKALASWNGLAIGGLALVGQIDKAKKCAEVWREAYRTHGYLPHQITEGEASGRGLLDDYGCLARGVLLLAKATDDTALMAFAMELLDQAREQFRDPNNGDYFFVSSESEELFGRTKPAMDRAEPSPNGVLAHALLLADRSEEALEVVRANAGWIYGVPQATETLQEVLLELALKDPELAGRPLTEATVEGQVTASLEPVEARVDEEGIAHTEVVLSIPEGLHLNSDEPHAEWLTPTALEIEGARAEAGFPDTDDGKFSGEVRLPIKIHKSEPGDFTIRLKYQACTDRACLPPQETSLKGKIVLGGQ
jgi:hypothetical protein